MPGVDPHRRGRPWADDADQEQVAELRAESDRNVQAIREHEQAERKAMQRTIDEQAAEIRDLKAKLYAISVLAGAPS